MASLTLELLQPADDTRLIGSGAQPLKASLTQPAPVPLFCKWYSSLAADPVATALDAPGVQLPLGSQVLTVSVKDRLGDDAGALSAVVHAGMAGGPPEGGQPCRVHVLIADLRAPSAGATISRAGATLSARAPSQWGREKAPAGSKVYEPNPNYQGLNKLRYLWRFAPAGAPAGRHSGQLAPTDGRWTFVPPKADDGTHPDVPLLRYAGPLPAGLDTGPYTLTLRVEHADMPAQGHEQSISVVLS
jgi:hypothetical protein